MGDDATTVSPSALPHESLAHDQGPLHLAIIVTLVLVSLLLYTLRVFTRAKILRSFDIDDGLMLVAALCTIGIFITFSGVVELGLGQQYGDVASSIGKNAKIGPWLWALKSFLIFGLGLVKLSAAFTLLPVTDSRFHPYVYICRGVLIIGFILLVFWHTIEWFLASLLQCIPLAAAWDLSYGQRPNCMSESESRHWAMANHPINAASSLLLVFFALPTVIGHSYKLGLMLYFALIALLALFACAIAITRSRMVATSWAEIGARGKNDLSFMTLGIVELLTAMIAVNLSTLLPLSSAIKRPQPPRTSPSKSRLISGPVAGSAVHVTHGDVESIFSANANGNSNSQNSRFSGQTIIYRPNTAYFPASYNNRQDNNLTRFHDDESNLDFDIEAPSVRSTRKLTKPCPPSRFSGSTTYTNETCRVSDWSQFSGFKYYTNNSSGDIDTTKEKKSRARFSAKELTEIAKSLGVRRQFSNGDYEKEIRVVSQRSEDSEFSSDAFPSIFLEDDSERVYSPLGLDFMEDKDDQVPATAAPVCTCSIFQIQSSNSIGVRGSDAVSLQSQPDSSDITVIRARADARCAVHVSSSDHA
ncbi:hypothetical protein DDE82_006534 [Stemphylium lycopersici]|nr:hypothetical protein DDE82_006534 [Stemphylium lycopersici]